MNKKTFPMLRINTRIPAEHHAWIKKEALKKKKSEGQVLRDILALYIKTNK
jgi:hypothetical protein